MNMRIETTLRVIAGLSFLLLVGLNFVNAQILQTRSEIIQNEGWDYTSGVADDGTKYIYYSKTVYTQASGEYVQGRAFYFITLDDGSEVCFMKKIVEPSSETNPNVAYLKSKLVEVGYMQWKDYENSIIYDVEVEDGLCIIMAWYDNKK